jgi:hypothetical protein
VALTVVLAMTLAGLPSATRAGENELPQYGMRAGFSVAPDQFTVGGFWGFSEFVDGLRFRPSADVGFGDHLTTFLLNTDLQYGFHRLELSVLPYLGFSPSFVYTKFEDRGTPGFDDSHSDIGFAIYGGVEKDLGGYRTGALEVRGGLDNYPDFKFVVSLGFL